MHKTRKRIVAALAGLAMIITPSTALADGDFCNTYAQVESNATGGQYVGGILIYETMASITRDEETTTVSTTVSANTSVGVPGSSAGGSTTTTVTTTEGKRTTTTEEPVGYYAMNDGSVYQVNCVTGESRKVS